MVESIRLGFRELFKPRGVVKAYAHKTGISASELYSFADLTDNGRDPSLAKLRQFLVTSGKHLPLQNFCEDVGLGHAAPERVPVVQALAHYMKESGEGVTSVAKGLAVSGLSKPEIRAALRELDEAEAAYQALREALVRELKRAR
jgi:hypothetical protein